MRKLLLTLMLAAPTIGAQRTVDVRIATWTPGAARVVYPPVLAGAGVAGVVDVRFVVDTLGRVDTSSIQIMKSTHELFSTRVRDAVSAGHATRAVVNGVPRRQVVVHRFVFAPRSEHVCHQRAPEIASDVTLVCAPENIGAPRDDERTERPANPFAPARPPNSGGLSGQQLRELFRR